MIKRSLLLSSLLLVAGSLQAQAPDLDKAKQTAETLCAACHMADGNSQLAANPKIAGQHEDYLFKQLREFKGWNGNPPVRENAIMGGMVAGRGGRSRRPTPSAAARPTGRSRSSW